MLEATISHRVAFLWSSPLTSSLLHWLVGIVYMLQISIFVSLLREVISVLLPSACTPYVFTPCNLSVNAFDKGHLTAL
jgi:hypothetical protein